MPSESDPNETKLLIRDGGKQPAFYGTAVHAEFDAWLARNVCPKCGRKFVVNRFPNLVCECGLKAEVMVIYDRR